ncbi:hypothetical protein HXA35_19890 [Bacillus sp. A301a_S52]|jgi:hypothetical protein|nr:hypothetical protein [Bacillus sp. A301a_S52]
MNKGLAELYREVLILYWYILLSNLHNNQYIMISIFIKGLNNGGGKWREKKKSRKQESFRLPVAEWGFWKFPDERLSCTASPVWGEERNSLLHEGCNLLTVIERTLPDPHDNYTIILLAHFLLFVKETVNHFL